MDHNNKTIEWICANLVRANEATKIMAGSILSNHKAIRRLGFVGIVMIGGIYIHEKRLQAVEKKTDELEDKLRRISSELSYLKGDDDLDA